MENNQIDYTELKQYVSNRLIELKKILAEIDEITITKQAIDFYYSTNKT